MQRCERYFQLGSSLFFSHRTFQKHLCVWSTDCVSNCGESITYAFYASNITGSRFLTSFPVTNALVDFFVPDCRSDSECDSGNECHRTCATDSNACTGFCSAIPGLRTHTILEYWNIWIWFWNYSSNSFLRSERHRRYLDLRFVVFSTHGFFECSKLKATITLPDSQTINYRLTLAATSTVTITVCAAYDSYLRVYNEASTLLFSNDDTSGLGCSHNSRISGSLSAVSEILSAKNIQELTLFCS